MTAIVSAAPRASIAPRDVSDDLDFTDFTESGYRCVLAAAKRRYRFERFGTSCADAHVLWRHDVDFSPHRAARLAELEAEEGVTATYFFWLHSPFYNVLERAVVDLARRIIHERGHALGLHFDSGFYGLLSDRGALEGKIAHEAALLGDVVGAPVEAFSFHNPEVVNDDLAFGEDEVAGLVNAYGSSIRDHYAYVSDANGYWRFRRLLNVLLDGADERLHVLTHPEWWQAEPMPPRQRVVRCVEGRAARTLQDYDELLAREDRLNVT